MAQTPQTRLDETEAPTAKVVGGVNKGFPEGYAPTEDEEYMNPQQLAYFKDLLLTWRHELEKEGLETVRDLQEHSAIQADPNDQATIEYEQAVELRTRDRERKLINKINEALERIDEGDFGFCEETGDPIGIKRLLARPIATLCIEAKLRQERKEVGYAD